MPNKNRHKIVAVFVAFGVSSFSISLFFLLVSPYFLLFRDILDPQNSPPNEVTGIYIYIYVHMRAVELKLVQKLTFSESKLGSQCFLYVSPCLFFQNILLSARRMRFFKRGPRVKLTIFLSQKLVQLRCATCLDQFWLKLGAMFDSSNMAFLAVLGFFKYAETTIFIVFSANMYVLSSPQTIRNAVCEHNCATWKKMSFLFCFFDFGVSAVSGFYRLSFGEEWRSKKRKTKKGNKTTRCKTRNHLVLLTGKKKADNTDIKQYNFIFRLETNNTRKAKNNNIEHKTRRPSNQHDSIKH